MKETHACKDNCPIIFQFLKLYIPDPTTKRKMEYFERRGIGYGYKFPGGYEPEAYKITNYGPCRRLDGLECDYKGFQYLLTKAVANDERQRLQIDSAEEEISRTPAEVYVAKCGLRFDIADKRGSIRRGCTHDKNKNKCHRCFNHRCFKLSTISSVGEIS